MTEPKIISEIIYGHSECRAWFEAEIQEDGTIKLIGMGSKTDYDKNGKIVGHKTEPTGITARFVSGIKEKDNFSWKKRFLGIK
jgi:hypothetical protein